MNEIPLNIDSFGNPLRAMMEQARWSYLKSIEFQNSPDGEEFKSNYLRLKKEIENYLAEYHSL